MPKDFHLVTILHFAKLREIVDKLRLTANLAYYN